MGRVDKKIPAKRGNVIFSRRVFSDGYFFGPSAPFVFGAGVYFSQPAGNGVFSFVGSDEKLHVGMFHDVGFRGILIFSP